MKRKFIPKLDCSTRGKRRTLLTSAIFMLEQISLAESAYLDNMPINLYASDFYDTIDYSISQLEEAIDVLYSVYDKRF